MGSVIASSWHCSFVAVANCSHNGVMLECWPRPCSLLLVACQLVMRHQSPCGLCIRREMWNGVPGTVPKATTSSAVGAVSSLWGKVLGAGAGALVAVTCMTIHSIHEQPKQRYPMLTV